jgi:hypothetical protein
MPKTAPVLTRTNRVASRETDSNQSRAAPTDAVARLC